MEWLDRSPERFDPQVAEAWAWFAARYPDIAAELFDDDPDLMARIASPDSSRA